MGDLTAEQQSLVNAGCTRPLGPLRIERTLHPLQGRTTTCHYKCGCVWETWYIDGLDCGGPLHSCPAAAASDAKVIRVLREARAAVLQMMDASRD